ncbi:N-acyl homoserine lactonase family protein [Rhodococcus pyridinivorans]|uniref:N-acyl homoserine lactonase family protein n=1 Tax=Rhodococcus pyridinivorans TaxID=103816 RepID=UPI00342569F1
MEHSAKAVRNVWALDAPTMTCDKSIFVIGAGGENVTVPVPAFLIEHDDGLVLYDTSFDPDAAGDPESIYGPLAAAFQIDFPVECRLDTQIEKLGFSLTDVKRVVISHSHFDHTGGLRLFPHAEGYIGTGELRYAGRPDPFCIGFFRKEDLEAANRITWNEVPTGYDHDLFGDGSITLLSLPGHSPGHLGMKIELPDRTLVLAGDAGHLRDNLAGGVGMPFDNDSITKLDSLRRLNLKQKQSNTTVWLSHDPDDWAVRGWLRELN